MLYNTLRSDNSFNFATIVRLRNENKFTPASWKRHCFYCLTFSRPGNTPICGWRFEHVDTIVYICNIEEIPRDFLFYFFSILKRTLYILYNSWIGTTDMYSAATTHWCGVPHERFNLFNLSTYDGENHMK